MTTTTADGWLSEILRDPASDFFRLAWADEVEARDGPGDAEHAEFVRTQISLVMLHHDVTEERCVDDVCHACRQIERLRRRERELLAEHVREWFGAFFWPDGTIRDVTPHDVRYEVRRGFVEEVVCKLETWTGGVCRKCKGTREVTVGHRIGGAVKWGCRDCRSVGRAAGVGAALVACQPVTTVRVTDREPFGRYTAWSWWNAGRAHASDEHPKSNLPTEVFALLRGGRDRMYDSEAAALADLSAALIRLAKGGDA